MQKLNRWGLYTEGLGADDDIGTLASNTTTNPSSIKATLNGRGGEGRGGGEKREREKGEI